MDKDCIFCKIINGDIPSFKIYEDQEYLAFFDISQFTKGHTLVIPKKHYTNVWEVEDIGSYMKVVQAIVKHFKSKGFIYVDTLTFGRLVPHAHIHLVPHNGDDPDWEKGLSGLEYLHSDKHLKRDMEELKKIAAEFKL
jgi:histidine triad (HIT) family protein